jgi:tRNA 2-thiouridine synthesizing protein E
MANNTGFLKIFENWNEQFALEAAREEQIQLSEDHWKVIYFLRDYYKKNQQSPAIRQLVKSLKQIHGAKLGNSLYLQILFPESPAVQAAKIAGLPKPERCI